MKNNYHQYATWSLMVCLTIWVGFSLFGNRNPVNMIVLHVTDTAPGHTAVVILRGEATRDCEGYAHRWLYDKDHNYYALPDEPIFHPDLNTPVTFYHDFVVPKEITIGPAKYEVTVTRWCNIWQWAFNPIQNRYSKDFTVVAPSAPK